MVVEPSTGVGNRHSRRRLLHRCMGRVPLWIQQAISLAFVDPAYLCSELGRTSLVPNALGYVRDGPERCFCRLLYCRRNARSCAVAVARNTRCPAGCRLRHDPAPDPDPVSRRLHSCRCPSAGQYRHDCGQSRRTRQGRTRSDIPQSECQSGGVEECLVLVRIDLSVDSLRWLFQVLPS